MKLMYRGATYDYNFVKGAADQLFQRTHASKFHKLIYRGNTYQVDSNAIAKASRQPVVNKLFYRGVIY